MALPENVRGTDLPRLLNLAEKALDITSLTTTGNDENPDFCMNDGAAYNAHTEAIVTAVSKFIDAANDVARLMDEEALKDDYPWLDHIAQFDGACGEHFEVLEEAGTGPVDTSNQYPQAVMRIRTATHLLTGVHKITKERQSNRRGPKRQEDWILPVIMAVAVYMTEQPGLTFERSWPEWASDLSQISQPPTRTIQLIVALLGAYGIEYNYPRIRTRLNECAQRLASDVAAERHFWP